MAIETGSTGVWYYPDALTSDAAVGFAQRIEALGYAALWLPEAGGRDPFALAARLLDHTDRLVVATGVANLYARDAMAMKAAQYTLAEQSGGRFVLGIGVSHSALVEDVRGHRYGKPLGTMRAYLEAMDAAAYGGPAPAERPPTVIAALGPQMLELARDLADGAHPYLVTPEHTRGARAALGTGKLLCVEQKVLLEPDAAKARDIARRNPAIAMGLSLPNYRRSLARQGYGEAEFPGGVPSDRAIDAVVAHGEADVLRTRVDAHFAAGATHVCVHPFDPSEGAGGAEPPWAVLEALAPR